NALHAKCHSVLNCILFSSRKPPPPTRPGKIAPSFVSAVKGILPTPVLSPPAMVLDDSCMVTTDLRNYVMGEVKLFSSVNNLRVILSAEGFSIQKVVYLGGLWVMFELPSANSKSKFLAHVGVGSWFKSLSNPQPDFSPRDRIIWVDVEGVPMHAWSSNTFHKIGSMWGEVLELGDCKDECFARKRLCIKTNRDDNILEKFKIIVKGKSFVVRAKELFVWSPSFVEVTEADDIHEEGEKERTLFNLGDFGRDDIGRSNHGFLDGRRAMAENVSDMEIKSLWGNTNFDAIVSQSLGFDNMITHTWNSINLNDSNAMVRFKKKFQALKKVIRLWIGNYKRNQMNRTTEIKIKLKDIDKLLDQLGANDDLLSVRSELLKQYHDIHSVEMRESIQKAKIKWAVEGDENSKFFHVKDGFRDSFASRFCDPGIPVEWFFHHASFPVGCNSSFIALIPKTLNPKSVGEYRPISLIGSIYKIVTKILASSFTGRGEESAQLSWIYDLLDTVMLSNMGDRRFWDLNGDRCFRVKDVRRLLDNMLFPNSDVPSRWVKQIPIKVNVLGMGVLYGRLPLRLIWHRLGVQLLASVLLTSPLDQTQMYGGDLSLGM
ncbi:hypothetical protein Tco_1139364, partial [Tanacetum coccineum]